MTLAAGLCLRLSASHADRCDARIGQFGAGGVAAVELPFEVSTVSACGDRGQLAAALGGMTDQVVQANPKVADPAFIVDPPSGVAAIYDRQMDLRRWIDDELALVADRVATQVLEHVPVERRSEPVEGGSSITFLLWHVTRHHDLAINVALLGRTQVLEEHPGVAQEQVPVWAGLPEAEDRDLAASLDPVAVANYHAAVIDSTRTWLAAADLGVLDLAIDGPAALARVGIGEGEFPWLHRMWGGKTGAFFVQWEAVGHELNHLGEMVAVRNRMGLSPF